MSNPAPVTWRPVVAAPSAPAPEMLSEGDAYEGDGWGPAHSGLRALVHVARLRGIDISFEALIRDFSLSSEPSTAMLVRIARSIGLRAKAVRMKWSQLADLGEAAPAIVRLSNGNAMMVMGVSTAPVSAVLLLDPLALEAGPFPVDELRFTEAWNGEVILLKKAIVLDEGERAFGFSWFVDEMAKQWKVFGDVAASALLLSALAMGVPICTQLIIDRVMVHHSQNTLYVLLAGAGLAVLFETGFTALRRYLVLHATNRIDARISMRTFAKMLRLPMDFFEQSATGVLAKNMTQVEKIRGFLTGQLFGTVLDIIGLLVFLPAMLMYSVPLTLVVLLFTGFICLVVLAFLPAIRRRMLTLYEAEARQQSYLVETLHGMRTVKSLSLDARQRRGWDTRVATSIKLRFEVGKLMTVVEALLTPAERLASIAVLGLGAVLVLNNHMLVGALIAFNMLVGRVTHPLIQAAQLLQQYQEAALSVRMLATIMNREEEPGRTGRGTSSPIKGEIEFVDVRFRYQPTSAPALDGVSFSVPAGTILGIMGRSGSGKTTITRLLQGLHSPQEGLIRIDGIDLREIDIDHLRANVGVVLQDNFLFRGSIRENIAAGKPGATSEEIMEAARLAGAAEFIERLPRGYDTLLEEGSANLSGGQRQRIAIARALLPNPPVLILDEATSALDAESEAIVQANLLSMARGRTLIIISHRLSSLVTADQILVLERGKLEDAGEHPQLLSRCDVYKRLWRQQNRHIEHIP